MRRGAYLEIVDALRRQGARAKADMHELWRRIVFTVLISNVDDHMRNHGFLYAAPDGWILSPAYDPNPVPVDVRPRVLTTAIDFDDTTASLESRARRRRGRLDRVAAMRTRPSRIFRTLAFSVSLGVG